MLTARHGAGYFFEVNLDTLHPVVCILLMSIPGGATKRA